MHVTNTIEQNTTMDMSLELVHNYKISFLNSVHIFLLQFSVPCI